MTIHSLARFAAWPVLAVTFGLAACASSPDVPPPSGAPAAGESTEYLIGPGDTLEVFVWRNPDVSTVVQVRPDGRISTPLVEDLQAVGKSPTQLARDIETVLAEYIRSPNVTVIVQRFVGTFNEQIRVVGQAMQPRSLPYRERMTVLDVMIEVGGLTEAAAGNRATIIRQTPTGKESIRVRLNDLLNKGRIDQNIEMMPGDVLIIPESIF